MAGDCRAGRLVAATVEDCAAAVCLEGALTYLPLVWQLRSVEHAVEGAAALDAQRVCAEQLQRLTQIEQHVNQLTIPLSFAEELYDLRSHFNFVRKRIIWLQQNAYGSDTSNQAPTQGNPA